LNLDFQTLASSSILLSSSEKRRRILKAEENKDMGVQLQLPDPQPYTSQNKSFDFPSTPQT
jgi:hypothetical protein